MGVTLLTRDNLPAFDARVGALRAESPRLWGTLTPIGMLAHLEATLEISLGEHALADRSTFFTRTLLRWAALHVTPTRWPKGKVKAPAEALPAPVEDFDQQREGLQRAMRRFAARAEAEPGCVVPHPIFGRLSLRHWQRFHGCHFDHHLRQFGV